MKIDSARFHDNKAHGEDSIDICKVDGHVCAVVADGITMSGRGGLASRFATNAIVRGFRSVYAEPRCIASAFDIFVETIYFALQKRLPAAREGGAETTLTVVVVESQMITMSERESVTAHYFALGDSPIIVCRQQELAPGLSDHSFVAHQIHDRPIVVEEEGRLYSFLDASSGKLCGIPSIGSFQLFDGDICLVMTDGIPFYPHIIRDVGEGFCFRFLNAVVREGASAGVKWFKKFVAKERLADDGSMAILKCMRSDQAASVRRLREH